MAADFSLSSLARKLNLSMAQLRAELKALALTPLPNETLSEADWNTVLKRQAVSGENKSGIAPVARKSVSAAPKQVMAVNILGAGGKRTVVNVQVRKKKLMPPVASKPTSPPPMPEADRTHEEAKPLEGLSNSSGGAARAVEAVELRSESNLMSMASKPSPELLSHLEETALRSAVNPIASGKGGEGALLTAKKPSAHVKEEPKPKAIAEKASKKKGKIEQRQLQTLKRVARDLAKEALNQSPEEALDFEPELEVSLSGNFKPTKLAIKPRISKPTGSTQSLKASHSLQQKFNKPVVTGTSLKSVQVSLPITTAELAMKLAVKSSELIRTFMQNGLMITLNQPLEPMHVELLAKCLKRTIEIESVQSREDQLLQTQEALRKTLVSTNRAPVVTVMGHVDHGKTSLLDTIRAAHLAGKEAGGITQSIGAYPVKVQKGSMTFIDTPGHAAFTAMRARGAQVTDIVILVVAADDGIMPQTIEAIQHAKAANVPIIVAVNKIDKPEANVSKVQEALLSYDLLPEAWGGETQVIPVSAKTGEGIEDLLEAILIQAELLSLSAPTVGPVKGVVLEAHLDKGRGPAATILVQAGTLKQGDYVVSGAVYGRVKTLQNATNQRITEAGPSTPVLLYGFGGLPVAGEMLLTVEDEKQAKTITSERARQAQFNKFSAKAPSLNVDELFSEFAQTMGAKTVLNLVIKADTQGSLEVLKEALSSLSQGQATVEIRGYGVGLISESDVHLAIASSAKLIGFNVRPDHKAKQLLEASQQTYQYYDVIYHLINDVKAELSGLLEPEKKEVVCGVAEVRAVFKSSKFGMIAGCFVKEGVIKRNLLARVIRDGVVAVEGHLTSLKRAKEDVLEVRAGIECGIGIKNYSQFKVNDRIDVIEIQVVSNKG